MSTLYQAAEAVASGAVASIVAWLLLGKDRDWVMLATIMGMVTLVTLIGMMIGAVVRFQ